MPSVPLVYPRSFVASVEQQPVIRGEIDLLRNYPKTKRDLESRNSNKTDEVRKIARLFGEEYFDGDRQFGYGGFNYNPKYWDQVVRDIFQHYRLSQESRILDIGCAKGFMLYDFKKNYPSIQVSGIDVSEYAIANSMPEVKQYLSLGNATDLPYDDKSFDLVISINTLHNLDKNDCGKALQEISRVTRKYAFITVDAYTNPEEYERIMKWNLTAKTILSTQEWKDFFVKYNYTFDYFWFTP
jgi:SAM-dependent methyltransferase